jgi:hypothetical protein
LSYHHLRPRLQQDPGLLSIDAGGWEIVKEGEFVGWHLDIDSELFLQVHKAMLAATRYTGCIP